MSYADNPHKNGRPTRAARATIASISMRFSPDELAALDHHMARGFTRGDLIREAMRRAGLFGDKWLAFRELDPPTGYSENRTFRLTKPELDALDRHVRRLTTKRAKLIRAAMDDMGLFTHTAVDVFPED